MEVEVKMRAGGRGEGGGRETRGQRKKGPEAEVPKTQSAKRAGGAARFRHHVSLGGTCSLGISLPPANTPGKLMHIQHEGRAGFEQTSLVGNENSRVAKVRTTECGLKMPRRLLRQCRKKKTRDGHSNTLRSPPTTLCGSAANRPA